MSTYVIADIHGEYDMFLKLLQEIDLQDADDLYILGDVVDRGPHPMKTLLKLMEMPNVIPIVGNHELMALEGLQFLNTEVTEETLASMDAATLNNYLSWQHNGGQTTVEEFRSLDPEMREEVLDFIRTFSLYEEVQAGGRSYLLVHAGLGGYEPDKDIEAYSLKDLVWERADYQTRYFDDVYTITGHTPTQNIEENQRPGYIYRVNNHIAIDCGACFPGGRLAAIRLEDGKEFYIERNDSNN